MATNGAEAVALARALQPDVVVLDSAMPELSGLEAVSQIKRSSPAEIVVFSASLPKHPPATFRSRRQKLHPERRRHPRPGRRRSHRRRAPPPSSLPKSPASFSPVFSPPNPARKRAARKPAFRRANATSRASSPMAARTKRSPAPWASVSAPRKPTAPACSGSSASAASRSRSLRHPERHRRSLGPNLSCI